MNSKESAVEMLKLIRELNKNRMQKKVLLEFLAEIDKNLENYYVMYQINRLRFFNLDIWQKVKDMDNIDFGEKVNQYILRLDKYNNVLSEYIDYDKWYGSDVKNKTKENGMTLHQKNLKAKEEFQGLEHDIKIAQESVRNKLENLKILKN